MDAHELLVRTMNAAKAARAQGFVNTAEALDEIAENLLRYINAQTIFTGDKRANSSPDVLHIH